MLEFKSDKLVAYSLKLAKIHRAALPNAIRFSLTDAAKDVKFRTLKKHANIQFDVSQQAFFRAFSGYKPAKGFSIDKMSSVAGMIKGNPKNSKSVASTEIAQQQIAGIVHNKSYIKSSIPNKVSNSAYRKARTQRPFIVEDGMRYVKKAFDAQKANKPLLVKKNKKGVLVKVGKISKAKGKIKIKTKPIASYKEDRSIDLKKQKPFVNNAAVESGKLLNTFFIKNAKKQIQRYMK